MLRFSLLSRNITGQFNRIINRINHNHHHHRHCNSIELWSNQQQQQQRQQIRNICSTSILFSFNDRIISEQHHSFMKRHIGPRDDDKIEMLQKIGFNVSLLFFLFY